MYECSECGKGYQSRSGLRRHVKREHGSGAEAVPVEMEPVPVEIVAGLGEDEEEPGLGEADEMALAAALEDLGIDADSVMAWTVYPDRVVIIEGPVGYKRVWRREG
jgi:hypothetical protein